MKPGVPSQRGGRGVESSAPDRDRPLQMPEPREIEPQEVMSEISLLVAVHLALALAVVSTLQALGIAVI